jgi:hypothetical protein
MTNGCNWLAVGSALVVCAIPTAAAQQATQRPEPFAAPVITDTARLRGPRQPIFFRHDIHAGQDQISCAYCHSTVTVSSEPGIPTLETCLGCHRVIQGSTDTHQSEIQKLWAAFSDGKAPQWVRVHTLPSFARFPHQRHVKVLGANAQGCANCHGDVTRMPQVYQVETLRMGWCINCHVQRKVSRDCTVCHY